MLGEFITRCLILLLGYAYPGFQCFKMVERNKVQNEELRFWCQYWVLVAFLTVLEDIADIFISWLPLYGEMKLALFIYLWYPKTNGTGFIYDAVLRPYVTNHENDIEKKLLEWRARIWDLAVFYLQNCSEFGQSAFLQVLEYFAGQSKRLSVNPIHHQDGTAPQLSSKRSSFFWNRKNKKSPTWSSDANYRDISETPKSETVKLHLDSKTEYLREEEAWEPQPLASFFAQRQHDPLNVKDRPNQAGTRQRR